METSIFTTLILVAQICSATIIVERIASLFWLRRMRPKEGYENIIKDLRSGNLEEALFKSSQIKAGEPWGSVAVAGIRAAMENGSKKEIQMRMDEILERESSRVEKFIGFLFVIANASIILGLFGTVAGFAHAIRGSLGASEIEKSVAISQGISLSMTSTIYGLIVAGCSLVAHAILKNRAARLSSDLNKVALGIFVNLGFYFEKTLKVEK